MKKALFLVFLLFGYPATAALPPKIQADLYLVQAEQERTKKAYPKAAESLEKILALQAQHPGEVKLPTKFYFRYAQILQLAGRHQHAMDAVTQYLEAGGQKSQYYQAALELLVQAEDMVSYEKTLSKSCKTAVAKPVTVTYAELKDQDGYTPLHYAAETNDIATVNNLIEKKGANVNARDKYGGTPLHKAAWSNACKIAALLLYNNANVNAKDGGGETPLHLAAQQNASETAELLRRNNADVNAENKFGDTPLHKTAYVNASETAELLLRNNANVNAKDGGGETPLHDAAYKNASETAELLLRNNANVNAKDKNGDTPLRYAARENASETAELLRRHGARK